MTNKICEVCEEETFCEYLNKYEWHTACCGCDVPTEKEKWCSDCFSDYASTVFDTYDKWGEKKEKIIYITGVKID